MCQGKAHLVALHRFRGAAEVFAEFEEAAAHHAPELMPGAPQGRAAGPAAPEAALSAHDISALIRAAAAYVLGSPVGDDEPLSGAGLDSLGERTLSLLSMIIWLNWTPDKRRTAHALG